MSQNNGRVKRSEKGLLTPDNCVVAFIDHQPQMLFGTSNFDRQSIINSTVALAKATRIFDVPVVLTTVETKSFSGNIWPQLKAIFPGQKPIERSFMNSWDDKNFIAAIEKTGRKKIVLSGLWTETCVALPTIQAIHDGYEVYVAEDCCGDISQLAHDNAMRRVVQAGAKPVTSLSTLLEWQRDWANRDTYDAVMDLVKNHFGAYGGGDPRWSRFLAAGSNREVMRLRDDSTKLIDLNKRTVIPGLNDSHLHLIRGGLNYNLELRWDGVPSLADGFRMLREQAQRTPAGQWVRIVGGWSEFQFAERRMPTLDELNRAAPDTPVFVLHLYDRALLNRAALRAVGYTKDSPNPPGGRLFAMAPAIQPAFSLPGRTR